jgi:hypothetical protein
VIIMKKYSLFAGIFFVLTAAIAATYLTQNQTQVNRDPAANATDMISSISCILRSMAPHQEATAQTPNPEPYLALVDNALCDPGTASGSGSVPNYTRYWVKPTFQQGTLSVEAWSLTTNRSGFIKATMKNGVTDRPPFGEWSVDWCIERVPTEGSYETDPCAKKGHASIKVNGEYALYYRREASGSWTPYDKTSIGKVSQSKEDGYGKYVERKNDSTEANNNNSGYFAFAKGALKDVANGSPSCKDPRAEAAGMRRQLWEAWLYDPTTKEVMAEDTDEAAGFPVVKVGTSQTGWAGYEGVRLQGEKASQQSGTFKRLNGDNAVYTAFGSHGVLIKYINSKLEGGLAALDKTVLQANLFRNAFSDTLFDGAEYTPSTSNPWEDQSKVLYYWDHAAQKFVFFARNASANGRDGDTYYTFPEPYRWSIAELLAKMRQSARVADPGVYSTDNDNYRNYERSIWGFMRGSDIDHWIVLADRDISYPAAPLDVDEVFVKRLTQVKVTPGSSDAPTEDLVCIGKCPRYNGDAKLQLETQWDFSTTDARVTDYYSLQSNGDLTLNAATDKKIIYTADNINRNGIDTTRTDLWLDAFVPKSQLDKLRCQDGNSYCSYDTVMPGNSKIDAGKETLGVRGLDYYYVWNTGPQRYQKFNGLKKDGVPVVMRPSKTLIYSVPDDQAYGSYAGLKTALKYVGAGQLWTPGRCINVASGGPVSTACDQSNEVYMHDFIIPDSETLGKVTDLSDKQFLVKWARQGMWYPLHASGDNACNTGSINSALALAADLTMPSLQIWTNPRGTSGDGNMLDRWPEVPADAVPRYIQGVKQ